MPSSYSQRRPFLVLEALDAGGSRTQTSLLVRRLHKEGYKPLQLHFPQEDRATGQLIYEKFLHHGRAKSFSRREQALLYIQDFFSRAEDMWAVLSASRGKGIVVSDRFCTSTMAYQTIGVSGKARRKLLDDITWLCWKGQPRLPEPDMVIFLDIAVETSLRHLKGRRKDYFENRAKLAAIRRSYLQLAREQGWIIINSMDAKGKQRSKAAIREDVWQSVQAVVH